MHILRYKHVDFSERTWLGVGQLQEGKGKCVGWGKLRGTEIEERQEWLSQAAKNGKKGKKSL